MHPTPRSLKLIPNLQINLQILPIRKHQPQYHRMHLLQQKIRTILIYPHNTTNNLLILTLKKPNFLYPPEKELDIVPLGVLYKFTKSERKGTNIFLLMKVKHVQ